VADDAHEPGAGRHSGIFHHAVDLFAAAWGYLRTRLELAGVEGREAISHGIKSLGLLLAGLFVVAFGYLFLCLAMVFALAAAFGGGSAWIWVTLGAAVIHIAAGALMFIRARSLSRATLFEATLDEFKKDQAWIEEKIGKQR
jgi:uncharacterized membrane protein YqjE